MNINDGYRQNVGICVMNKDRKILICKRVDNNGWQMPQGGVKKNESEEETLYREAIEEIGTDNFKIIKKSNNIYKYNTPNYFFKPKNKQQIIGQKQRWFLVLFEGNESEINLNTKEPEFCEWEWKDYKDVIDLCIDFKKQVYIDLFNEFKKYIV